MRFIHISDLHIGKRVNEFSMLDEQKNIFEQILDIARDKKADGIIIAGDIYDKAVAPAEAVGVFDELLTQLADMGLKAYIISGNHDSAERLAFASRLVDNRGIYISPVYNGKITMISEEDEFGSLNIFLMPFLKTSAIRPFYPDEDFKSCNEAIKRVVDDLCLDTQKRNILVAHQFVLGAALSESEEFSVGEADAISADIFKGFDYTALGHIHKAQGVGAENIRYSGTPLKYSFSEVNHRKCLTVVDVLEKGRIEISEVPLRPLKDMRHIRGSYDEICARESYINTNTDDYMRITLTNEEEVIDAIGRLRSIYPNIMRLDYDNTRTRLKQSLPENLSVSKKTPLEIFREFYLHLNGKEMSDEQIKLVMEIIEEVGGDQK